MEWTMDEGLAWLRDHAAKRRQSRLGGETKEGRREQVRNHLRGVLGEWPDHPMPLHPRLLEQVDGGDYILERIAYTTMEGVHVPVIVLLPKGGSGPKPAVLACHGHGNGQWDALGMDAAGRELKDAGSHARFAMRLVRQGMVVIVPEAMGFGSRRVASELALGTHDNSCASLSMQLLMYGRTLAGMRVYEALRAVDYLAAREEVDTGRIGVFGFSGGGLIGAYAAVLDERIKAAVLCGWGNTFEGSIMGRLHCIDNYVPGMLPGAEQPDLMGAIAPRALFLETGEQDRTFPAGPARQAIAELEAIYADWDAADRFGWDIHAGGHVIDGGVSMKWLQEQLSL